MVPWSGQLTMRPDVLRMVRGLCGAALLLCKAASEREGVNGVECMGKRARKDLLRVCEYPRVKECVKAP